MQCTAACLGWHMAVHRRLGVSPVWAEGQVAGRPYPIILYSRKIDGSADGILPQVRMLYVGRLHSGTQGQS